MKTSPSGLIKEPMIKEQLKVEALLFPGFELLDLYGPLEMLGHLNDRVQISLIAETPGPVRSSSGPFGYAEASLLSETAPGLLLIPGGIGTRTLVNNPGFLELLSARAEKSRLIASVCTGSALLAKTGLLDGLRATTNKIAFDWVREQGPAVHWIRKARWVEEERIWTSSGISAGLDMTLALIAHLYGRETAVEVARQAEYLWNENPELDPFA